LHGNATECEEKERFPHTSSADSVVVQAEIATTDSRKRRESALRSGDAADWSARSRDARCARGNWFMRGSRREKMERDVIVAK